MQITHCPQCKTAFKVSPQQQEMAKGRVRCGRCRHVFEAALHFDTPAVMATEATRQTKIATTARSSSALAWMCGVGLLALLWQFLVLQRNWLAAQEPALSPMLSAMCGCEVQWPREPDAVLIESSSFTENPEGGYTVQLRLRNTQPYPVAMLALELSLTDLQDQVLVRRVVTAHDLSDKDHLRALGDVRSTLNFDLDAKVSNRVTGFRALIFYP